MCYLFTCIKSEKRTEIVRLRQKQKFWLHCLWFLSVILKFFNVVFQHSRKEDMKLKFMHTETSIGMIVKSYSLLWAPSVCWLGHWLQPYFPREPNAHRHVCQGEKQKALSCAEREELIQSILGICAVNSVLERRINPPGSSEAAHARCFFWSF